MKQLFLRPLRYSGILALVLLVLFHVPDGICRDNPTSDLSGGMVTATPGFNALDAAAPSVAMAKTSEAAPKEMDTNGEKQGSQAELNGGIWQELKDGFSFTFRALGFGTITEPSDSTQNPNNDFLKIPSYSLNMDLRPDLALKFRNITLVAKPRLDLVWDRWGKGSLDGETDSDDDWYMQEWLASVNPFDGLFVSYGRENIQWGPSYLVSPSNPFFRYNGQANPKIEVPGMDFARLVWVPSSTWTASFLANVGRGREVFPYGFENNYAVKLDYTAYRKQASLIASYQEENRATLGAYGSWWVSDALMVYGEGSISRGTNVLYPVEDPTSPFGIQMSPAKDDEGSPEGLFTAGTSYTLESGATFTLEYFFNGPGYTDAEAQRYYQLRGQAADAFLGPEPGSSLAQMTLKETADPKLRFLRRNYLTFQYYQVEIADTLNLMLRYTYSLDDGSSFVVPMVEYNIGDYFQIFAVGNHHFGARNSEFKSATDYTYMLGVQFYY